MREAEMGWNGGGGKRQKEICGSGYGKREGSCVCVCKGGWDTGEVTKKNKIKSRIERKTRHRQGEKETRQRDVDHTYDNKHTTFSALLFVCQFKIVMT